ncbi:MAG: isoleucyl-tRNA synthetase [Flavobacteriales bacterium]|jgi:isoleucyl-tRNA synthetase
MAKYAEQKQLDLPQISKTVLDQWDKNDIFNRSITSKEGAPSYVFYEGPPSANGMPGIHHVMSRAIKDIFCRYKTLKGFQVNRKAGWDTHGLPVELGVEKELGITKEDIGKKISVEDYNKACREAVMRYTDVWNSLTKQMGYWVDMNDPYITYTPKYMESVWFLLKKLYTKNFMYKGYTIQPYSPAAGTGLSSHEINQPGCYRDVKDTTIVAQFKAVESAQKKALFGEDAIDFIAWTTTPWTLPSNTALAVGKNIDYILVKSYNQYTYQAMRVLLAKDLLAKSFNGKYAPANDELPLDGYSEGDKKIPYAVISEHKGADLVGLTYEQLLPYTLPFEDADKAFQVIAGDFVTTSDGTGIVHIAPTFGADDAKVAKDAGIPPMLVLNDEENPVPLVDLQGKFVKQMGEEFGGMYVKNEYFAEGEVPEKSADVLIAIKLKEENKAFKVEKYEHSYPHCWRTDKPILYYPLDSWFIKTTAVKDRLIALNNTINWKPESTGTGRFGNWLENLNDWNLSRSRYWGVPIPIWRTEDGNEAICIGSVEELMTEINKAVAAGVMDKNPFADFVVGDMSESNYSILDLHKNIVDQITLVSSKGEAMSRESDLIDVWFDSGAMPYAQLHYPFENKELIDNNKSFPADFIAEGVDQTRGWFFTLHAIATMCFDQVAYKNVVSNGLVLDKKGQKMSKRLGNAADPFETLDKYGADATRWYMISNAQPWDNLKFDFDGITEVQRKFFRALHNTYSFMVLYANIDNFTYSEADIPLTERPEIDQWIISKLNSLVAKVDECYDTYEPTKAAREIQEFAVDHLSNWYVRLCRRRFWKGDYSSDKIAAYQTLYTCLSTIAKLAAPIAPFYSDYLFNNLNQTSQLEEVDSVHLSSFPVVNESFINKELEEQMQIAQQVSSMVLALRKKENIRVRQPLQKIMIPAIDANFKKRITTVQELILSEVNVKELILIEDTTGVFVKQIKADFKKLGPKFGKQMKAVAATIIRFSQDDITAMEVNGHFDIDVDGQSLTIDVTDVEIITKDIPGWLVATESNITVALDVTISESLKDEGIAREVINRIQNLRKDMAFDVTDKIIIEVKHHDALNAAIKNNLNYICSETLADTLSLVDNIEVGELMEVTDSISTTIAINKLN